MLRTMKKSRLKLFYYPGQSSSMLYCPVKHRRIDRLTGQRMHLFRHPGHIEYRRHGIALRTKSAISAAVHMVFTNVVFAAERTFKVPGTLIKRGTFRAATVSVVHTGSHLSLAFDYG